VAALADLDGVEALALGVVEGAIHARDEVAGEPARADQHAMAAGGLPLPLAAEHAEAHVEHAQESDQLGGGEVERLVVDLKPDDRPVGGGHDRLAGAGEAVSKETVASHATRIRDQLPRTSGRDPESTP
jgi:hypothetical protein